MMDKRAKTLLILCLLMVVGSGVLMTVRLVTVGRPIRILGKKTTTPLLSANDRSRWLTIRSLSDSGGYAVDQYTRLPGWDSIDKVVHQDRNGNLHQYSSKPPLLATILTPIYLANRSIFGWDLRKDWFSAVWGLLFVTQVIPYCLTLWFFSKTLIEVADSQQTFSATRYWAILFVSFVACFGTFLTTFSITLNNHTFAAIGCFWTLISLAKVSTLGIKKHFWFAIGGVAAAFTAANELPALSFMCVACGFFFLISPKQFFAGTLPAVGFVAFMFFGTNLVAHNSLKPPYAHRSDGKILCDLSDVMNDGEIKDGWLKPSQIDRINRKLPVGYGNPIAKTATIQRSQFPLEKGVKNRWAVRSFPVAGNLFEFRSHAICKLTGSGKIVLKKWDNWYDYPGSYWFNNVRKGVDQGEKEPAVYAFHCLLGHHGIFSLTPVWVFSFFGLILGFWATKDQKYLSFGIMLVTFVVIAFYLMRPQLDRNYGGVSCGLRWTFWMTPLWLVAMIPAIEKLASSKWLMGFATILAGVGIYSSVYPWNNPWIHPWIYNYWYQS